MGTSLISLNRKGMENNGQFVAEEIAIVAWFGTNLNDPKVPKALCSQFCGTHGRAGMKKSCLCLEMSKNISDWCCKSRIHWYHWLQDMTVPGGWTCSTHETTNPSSSTQPVRHKALPKKSKLCQVSPRKRVAARAVNTGLV